MPDFDPCDGGINAQVLFLLEAPGGRARSSGFVSRNNPDETARNSFELHREAGIPRELAALWNIVPWYVGSGTRIRPVEVGDLIAARPHIEVLLSLMTRLKAVVLVGRKAQRASGLFADFGLEVFESAHPSPIPMRTKPGTRAQILAAWQDVARFLSAASERAGHSA